MQQYSVEPSLCGAPFEHTRFVSATSGAAVVEQLNPRALALQPLTALAVQVSGGLGGGFGKLSSVV
jgi:hypothetical protein